MADTTLLDKVLDLKEKYGELQRQLSDPEVISDMKRYVQLNKEYKELDPIMKAGMEYKKMMDDYESAKEILATEKDEELREMAKEEVAEIEQRMPEMEENIKLLLIPVTYASPASLSFTRSINWCISFISCIFPCPPLTIYPKPTTLSILSFPGVL